MQIEKEHFFTKKDGKFVRRKDIEKEEPTPHCFVRSRLTERIAGEIAGIAHRRAGIAQWQQKMETPEGLAEVLIAYLEYGGPPLVQPTPERVAGEALNAALKLFVKYAHIGISRPPGKTDDPEGDIRNVAAWAIEAAEEIQPKSRTTPDGGASGQPGKTKETKDEAGPQQKPKVKEPPKEAQQAYQLYHGTGWAQSKVAEEMTKQLKRPVTQGQVSRWVRKYKAWREAEGISIDDRKPEIIINTHILDTGARTDGRITGDPRHRHKPTADSADDHD
jgi:hypothetical protein